MDITNTPPPKKICPVCSKEQTGIRCQVDQAYLVSYEARLGAKGDQFLGYEIGGRYGVVERLGMGGMGAVYKAIDPKRNMTVAIKVLREAYAQHPAIRERFIREAEAGASLQHPNVVPLIDFGIEDNGRLWLAMEFAEGWTLRDEINHNGAFTVRESVELMRQVLMGLAVAHDAGMIHRDLKHDNIMYHGRREKFIARIVDFGVVKSEAADLARSGLGQSGWKPPSKKKVLGRDEQGSFDLSEAFKEAQKEDSDKKESSPNNEDSQDLSQKALTAVGMMVGSPSYMAPEQIRGLKVGPPADLYALAVVTYEILAARRLFTVNDYETLLKEDAQRDAPRLVFSARGEIVPEPLADIIHTALAHDPTDRYPDAHTMLLALDQMKANHSELPLDLFCVLPDFVSKVQIKKTLSSANTVPEVDDIPLRNKEPKNISSSGVPKETLEGLVAFSSGSDDQPKTLPSSFDSTQLSSSATQAQESSSLMTYVLPPLVAMLVVWTFVRFIL